jgi:hypothetical protein
VLILTDPNMAHPQNWVELTLQFIERNSQGAELQPGLVEKLRQMHQSHKIVTGEFGPKRIGGFNRLIGKITLNSDRLGFLRRDFGKQLRGLEETEDARIQQIRDQHARDTLELSGVLIHEGAHALKLAWRRKADETVAFTCEQQWYAHLHRLSSDFKPEIQKLAQDAQYDASHSPEYRRLGLSVASRISERNKKITEC